MLAWLDSGSSLDHFGHFQALDLPTRCWLASFETLVWSRESGDFGARRKGFQPLVERIIEHA